MVIVRPGAGRGRSALEGEVVRKQNAAQKCHDIKVESKPLDVTTWKLLVTVSIRV